MNRLDPLVDALPYEQFVLVWPILEVKLWGVLTIDGDHKDYFMAESVESIQPHDTFCHTIDRFRLMGFCYPACKAVAHGFKAMVVSITDMTELYEVKYLPQGWAEGAHA